MHKLPTSFWSWARWVPIRRLGARHASRIQTHLLTLGEQDRYLRFAYAASDEQLVHYVQGLRFDLDHLLGIFDRRMRLIAVAHLAFSTQVQALHHAEFGVSVLPHARGRSYGSRLFRRAVVIARNHGITHLTIQALSENAPMLKIALHSGAKVERHGSESEALLRLPPADFDSHLSELLEDQAAEIDYQLKSRSYSFLGLRGLWERMHVWARRR